MAFKFNHRKLFTDPINETLTQFCTLYCNNDDGVCPIRCIACSPTCYRSIFSQIPPPPNFPTTSNNQQNKPNKFSLFLTISLSILAATFFLFCCYTIYKYFTCRFRSRRIAQPEPESEETRDEFLDEDRGPMLDHPIWYIRTVGLNPSVINAITICSYKRSEGLVEGTECSVCLSEFQEDETLRLLPKCNHAFHLPCIDTWLRSHTNCPMCRAGIVRNTTGEPSSEPVMDNSGLVEETHLEILENGSEFGRESEDEARELRIGIEEESEFGVENGIKGNEEVGNSEVQPMRRSVSLDSLSASMISVAIAKVYPVQSEGNSDTQLVKLNELNMGIVPKRVDVNQNLLRLVGNSSIGRSLQKGPFLMKRSFSFSGKVLLYRHSRSQSRNSVLPS